VKKSASPCTDTQREVRIEREFGNAGSTLRYIELWFAAAKFSSGPLLRIVRGKSEVLDSRMSSAAVAATLARAVLKIGLQSDCEARFSVTQRAVDGCARRAVDQVSMGKLSCMRIFRNVVPC